PSSHAEHSNQGIEARGIEQRAKYLQPVDCAIGHPGSVQRGEEVRVVDTAVILPEVRVSPGDVIAEEHVQKDEGDDDERKSPSRGGCAYILKGRRGLNGRWSAPPSEDQDSQWCEESCRDCSLQEERCDHTVGQFVGQEEYGFDLGGHGRNTVHSEPDGADERPSTPFRSQDQIRQDDSCADGEGQESPQEILLSRLSGSYLLSNLVEAGQGCA